MNLDSTILVNSINELLKNIENETPVISDSVVNGNIVVNNEEVEVYDDNTINQAISGKANINHEHKLADLIDVDITNKLNGNVLMYDEVLSKLKLSPLSNSTTSPENTTYPSSNQSSYIIELDRWKITKGIPSKPYINDHYFLANANITGINNALQFAYENGYSEVILPRGEYAVCYPQSIMMKTGITFNLNRSKLKVIFDSDNQSPLDTANRLTTNDAYKFGGNTITFSNVTNSHLINGEIIGCKVDRSFKNLNEVAVEWTYGVMIEKGTSFSSVKYCKISDYMGDNISFSTSSPVSFAEFEMGLQLAKINPATGSLVTEGVTNILTSGLIPIVNDWEQYGTIMLTGFGYARHTSIATKDFGIYFYSGTDQYLGGYAKRKIYEDLTMPPGAKKFRMVFYYETNTSKNMQITVRYGGITHHNLIEYNEITRGHRGGITGGGSYNTIQKNVIIDNGLGLGKFLDGKPIFNDPTRYSINQEDSYGDNIVIRDNYISGSYHGILVGCHSIYIENNIINNIDYIAINLYSMVYASVRGNYMYNNQQNIGLMWSNYSNAHVDFIGNSTHGGNIKLDGADGAYHVSMINNHIVDPTMILMDKKGIFKDNVIQFTNRGDSPASDINIPKAINCTFESKIVTGASYSQHMRLNYHNISYQDCIFDNLKVELPSVAGLKNTKDYFFNCEFNSSEVILTHFSNSHPARNVYISSSKFNDTFLKLGAIGIADKPRLVKISNSSIILNSSLITEFVYSDTNNGTSYSSFQMENCEFELSYPMAQFTRSSSSFHNDTVELSLKRVNFLYTGSSPFSMKYYADKRNIRKIIFAENKTKGMTFVAPDDMSKFIGYDPISYCVGEPNTGEYYFAGNTMKNVNPTTGGYLGWVCVSEGYACNTLWSSSTSYVTGHLVSANGKVYKCKVAGISGTTSPSHSTGSKTDNTVTWEYIGNQAVFKQYGKIDV